MGEHTEKELIQVGSKEGMHTLQRSEGGGVTLGEGI